MRYEIGKVIFAVHFTIKDHTGMQRQMFNRPHMYRDNDEIESISILKLTVVEHHKVSTAYSDEKNCDGFILIDSKGEKWNNQYPRASYGQMDDSADGNFLKDVPEGWTMKDFDNYKSPLEYYDLERFMSNLDRFIVRNKPTGKGLEIMKEALRYNKIKELYNQLADMMKERHNIKCVRKPVFENEPKAKNITHIVFEPIENKTKAAA